jgi:hypothetical protein
MLVYIYLNFDGLKTLGPTNSTYMCSAQNIFPFIPVLSSYRNVYNLAYTTMYSLCNVHMLGDNLWSNLHLNYWQKGLKDVK